ncbi:hypothetical protein [Streptomyces microflavus]|uniref:hypothetical protein n=1 Tax=Streptomyces microflavus TaxID=1919 RepID=UPI002E34B6B7|nr:hypothetical protein [Streptomyces microflavus]WSS31966.1 hypothetical protein OG269_00090 [Streptomyces microflavus]WST19487.1 hypothetical protein OG721_38555 [Streptomyces microflavus]
MTIACLPGPPDDVPPYEPWAGEPEVLAEATEAGRRAAAWIRSLPAPPALSPVGTWLATTLPGAVESATGSLDPAQCDRRGPDGRLIEGNGGVDAGTTSTLAVVPCVLSDVDWLTPDQHLRLMAVASVVTGIARLLADDPGTAILHGQVTRMCATLDHATRPDTPGLASGFEQAL